MPPGPARADRQGEAWIEHSSTSGRQASARAPSVAVALPAISSSAASSTPSTLPNSNEVDSTAPPRQDTIATPAASATR